MSAKGTDMNRLQDMIRLFRMGRSARRTARQLRMGRDTIRQYKDAFEQAGILDGTPEDLPTVEILQAAVKEHIAAKEPVQQISSVDCWRPKIEELLSKGAGPTPIHDYLYAANVSSTDQLTDPADIVIWLVSIDIQMKGKWSPRSVVGAHIRVHGALGDEDADKHLGVPVKRMKTAVFEILADNVVSSECRQAIIAFRKGDTTFLARRAAEAERKRVASLNEDTAGAVVYAEAIVRALLKSPSTAEFEGGGLLSGRPTTAKTQCLGDGLYVVTSFVDSQNGFGAMVRTDWSLKLKKGPGESWRVVKVLKMAAR